VQEKAHTATSIFVLFMYNSCLAIFLTYGVFFTKVTSEFQVSQFWTSLVFAVFAILYSVSSLGMGFLTDAFGASKTILLGGLLMSIGLVLSTFAPSIIVLILTYGVIAGSGTGSMWLPTSFSVFEKFEPSKIREVTGLVSAGTAFGSLFFAPLEAYLISEYSWRVAFFVLGIIVFVLTLSASFASRKRAKGETISDNSETESKSNLRRLDLTGAFRRIRNSTGFWSLYLYYMMGNAFSRTMVMVFLVPVLQERGFSVFLGSVALGLIGGGSMIGRLFTRFEMISEEQIAALSFLLQGFSAIILFYSSNFVAIYLASFVFGVGYGGYIPQFALIIRKRYGLSLYGGIFGILLTSFGIGAFFGPVLGAITLSVSGSYAVIFFLAFVWSVAIGLHQLVSFYHSAKKNTDL
jgi:OFA family oxalate/formate antiporter-like MFS transporter